MMTALEYLMGEPLPLHRVQEAIIDFCRGRRDVVVYGAQAVNLHVAEPRMSQDVDILTPRPREVAQALAERLHDEFGVAVRVREVKPDTGFRVYQQRREGSRHLADVRLSEIDLSDTVERDGVLFASLPLLVAMKVHAWSRRRLAPKGGTDIADLRRLLLARPDLRHDDAQVLESIEKIGGDEATRAAWQEVLSAPVVSDEDVDEGY